MGKGGAAATLLLIFMGKDISGALSPNCRLLCVLHCIFRQQKINGYPLGLVSSQGILSEKTTNSETFAVTSASSSEYIAVSSIFTYDIYQTYFNRSASGKMLINMAHSFVVIYAILLAAFSTGLYCEYL